MSRKRSSLQTGLQTGESAPQTATKAARSWARIAGIGITSLALCGVSLMAGALGSACADSESGSGTSGKRIVLQVDATSNPAAKSSFLAASGWNIKLSKAFVGLGGLYFFNGAAAAVGRFDAPAPRHRSLNFATWLLIPTAHAHPGHYQPGDALGQFLGAAVVDVLAPQVRLGLGDGVTGLYRSARVTLKAPTAETGPLGTQVAFAEGEASKGGKTVFFRLAADTADVAASAVSGNVDGCEFEATDVSSDGTVTLTIDPTVWFQLVDFTNVAPGTAATPTEPAKGTDAQLGFAIGLAQIGAYRFTFNP